MHSSIKLSIPNNLQVVAPDSLDLITPYVLQEQQDWFEDEIRFVRQLLKPGQKIIDIGANYGVYALSMAHAVGESGHVWAFEPASSTAAFLQESIAINRFEKRITLEQCALSHAEGTAELSLNVNAELNALQANKDASVPSETVPLVTLDACMARYQWQDIDLLKMDAEGEETNILKGGKDFFTNLSPLILYEIKAGDSVHLDLIHHFAALGYQSYRLVTGLNVLTPFDEAAPVDGYLLNLFCCKADRAAQLEMQGLLIRQKHSSPLPIETHHWSQALKKFPYANLLSDLWKKTISIENCSEIETALSHYAMSRDATLPIDVRFTALEASFLSLVKICEQDASYLRLASMARVAKDYGARSIAVLALQKLSTTIEKLKWMDPSEPFLVPCERFETTKPKAESLGNWLVAATLEELERLSFFSSFYSGQSTLQRLETIRQLGFSHSAMQRRLRLVKKRAGITA